MAKKATINADNIYYQSRIEAGITNRERAAEILGVDTSTLANWESYSPPPPLDKVRLMSKRYGDQTLPVRHCSEVCPLGGIHGKLERKDLTQAVLSALNEYKRLGKALEELADIADDGVVSADETKRIPQLVEAMQRMRQKITTAEYAVAAQIVS